MDLANCNGYTRAIADWGKERTDDLSYVIQQANDYFRHGNGRYVLNIMGELIITKRTKKQARKKRQMNEKKWLPYRILSWIFLSVSIVGFVIGMFLTDYHDHRRLSVFIAIYSMALVSFVVTRSLLTKASSHWIQDRLNERIWIDGNQLHHFLQTAFAAGLNIYNADERAYLFVMDISTIRNARYDDKSGRIEFTVDGSGYHYSDYRRNTIDKQWALKGFGAIFYDAATPGLFESLKNRGVPFEIGTINYKFTNQI